MKVNLSSLRDTAAWEQAGVRLPAFDIAAMREKTRKTPVWVHFGAGNIFRAFIAALQQRLLDSGDAECGIIAADTFDVDNIRMIYGGYDNLTMSVTLNADATIDKEIIASVSEALVAQPGERRTGNGCAKSLPPRPCRWFPSRLPKRDTPCGRSTDPTCRRWRRTWKKGPDIPAMP